MATTPHVGAAEARRTVFVDTFTDGLLGPDVPMLGPVHDGGHIVWNSTPGCWGPMLTPSIRGGHEVCQPVAVHGAQVGDAIAIRIKDISVASVATASAVRGRPSSSATSPKTSPEPRRLSVRRRPASVPVAMRICPRRTP